MKITRCDNGHFYDGERHAACPYCSDGAAGVLFPQADPFPSAAPLDMSPAPPAAEDLPALPAELALFELKEKLGQGGTASVYRLGVKRVRAVKVIPLRDENAWRRAEHEYEIARSLAGDRHFVQNSGLFRTDTHAFLLQDIERGWREFTRRERVTLGRACTVLQDVTLALIAMHRKGIHHMDVKPDNIFIDRQGRGRLGDFSHSLRAAPGSRHSAPVGTDRFMAPEVFEGGTFSDKEDMYSLGVTMYMLLTGGRFPFDFSDRDPAYRRREDRLMRGGELPAALYDLLEKATAYDPGDRYDSLYELFCEFTDIVNGMAMDQTDVSLDRRWESYKSVRTNGAPTLMPEIQGPDAPEDMWAWDTSCDTTGWPPVPDDEAGGRPHMYRPEAYYSTALDPDIPFPGAPSPAETVQSPPRVDEVYFSAFTDRSVRGDDYGVVEIAMYAEEDKEAILEQIREEFDHDFKEKTFPKEEVRAGQEVTVMLSSPAVEIEDGVVRRTWSGEGLLFTFDYYVPGDFGKKRIPFSADVYFDGVPATKLKFFVDVAGGEHACADFERIDIKKAFLSYASEDRARVTAILQGMKKVRPDLDVFFDVESLRSGQNWEKALYDELRQRDMLFLCWSHFAMASAWVEREWHFMLKNRGIDAIEPIPMEDPKFCPPPAELREKHFNDLEVQYRKLAVPLEPFQIEW